MVGSEERRADAPQQKEGEQAVDEIECQRASSREQSDSDDQSRRVEDQLLGYEVSIELKDLIGQRDDDGEDHPCLDDYPDKSL